MSYDNKIMSNATGQYIEGLWCGPDERVEKDKNGNPYIVRTIVIDNEKFFATIDNQVRHYFSSFEIRECLPRAKAILKAAKVTENELKEYPIEGYYYKDEQLRLYFKMVRNMQQNEALFDRINAIKPNEDLMFLSNILESDIFGNPVPEGEYYPWPNAPLKRRWDIMTHVMSNKTVFNEHAHRPWDIGSIVANVRRHYKGRYNLPELAALIGQAELLCAACETNSLGRMYACLSGSYALSAPRVEYKWSVYPEVEDLARNIVGLYNKKTKHKDYEMFVPTLATITGLGSWQEGNFRSFDYTLETPRVAHLGFLTETQEYYFWILEEGCRLTDIYTRDFITTETFKKKTNPWVNQGLVQHS